MVGVEEKKRQPASIDRAKNATGADPGDGVMFEKRRSYTGASRPTRNRVRSVRLFEIHFAASILTFSLK
jgi:hypothetical protein